VPKARLGRKRFKPDRAAGAQQSCPTSPHDPSRVRPSAPLKCPATRGLVVGPVAGIPRWHARGQGFKSPQLHQPQHTSRSPAQRRLSADCQQITSCDCWNTLSVDRFWCFSPFSDAGVVENFPCRSSRLALEAALATSAARRSMPVGLSAFPRRLTARSRCPQRASSSAALHLGRDSGRAAS
jgi:hypothetical protein